MKQIALFSVEADLHAHAVQHALGLRSGVTCHFVATDALARTGGLRWRPGERGPSEVRSYAGQWLDVRDLDLVWWRRVNQDQTYLDSTIDDDTRAFIDNEWRAGLFGLMMSAFSGRWINDPLREPIAGNKVFQLGIAESLGFRIPRTLISQHPASVRDFVRACGGRVVVKKLHGTATRPLATVVVGDEDLLEDRPIEVCPAIYQEVVRGGRHVRANCFGPAVHSVLIQSATLDWRRDLSVPFSPFELAADVNDRLVALLERLGLRMGIFDLMLDEEGQIIWLELNPQGQFLFGEALSGRDLTRPFVEFLISEAGTRVSPPLP